MSLVKATSMMVAAQVILSGMNILLKVAANDGMDNRVMVAYRFLFGAVFMLPLAFFVERKTRPKLTWKAFLYTCLGALFGGSLAQNLYIESLVLTSAAFVSAMLNLTPAITFLVAVCLRLENLGWNTVAGKAKILGTLLGISGAMLFTFYKGPDINVWKTNVNILEITSHNHVSQISARSDKKWNRILGVTLGFLSCICYSLWLIIQAKALVLYPAPVIYRSLDSDVSSFQLYDRDLRAERSQRVEAWMEYQTPYSFLFGKGFFSTAVMLPLVTTVVRMRGPLFVSVFNPLMLVIVAVVGSLVMDEDLHLGNLLGSIVIICGLYLVLWGKSKEGAVRTDNSSPPVVERIHSPRRDQEEPVNNNV